MADYHQQFFEECQRYTGDPGGQRVLVVGCGAGGDCRMFAEAGALVTGMDILDSIGSEFQDARVIYRRESITETTLPSDTFDIVFSIATLEHVHDLPAAFRHIHRVTAPGGWVYTLAAPLWHSRQGHHLSCLDPYPWVHLRHDAAGLAAFGDEHGLMHGDRPLRGVVDWLYHSPEFNRLPARDYLDASSLEFGHLERSFLWEDGEEDLHPALLAELERKGYRRAELLATSHSLIARK